jgi:2-dehydropantoate 2-reductase
VVTAVCGAAILLEHTRPVGGSATVILPVLNGTGHVGFLSGRFGKPCVLGGVCLVATVIDEAGRIQQFADFRGLNLIS